MALLVCSCSHAAEQKARVTYDNILRFTDDPDVREPIKFLREREIVHFQRFGETIQSRWSKKEIERAAGNFCVLATQIFYIEIAADDPLPLS